MNKQDIEYARNLMRSIEAGLEHTEKGSDCEGPYLREKTRKLFDLVRE